MTHNYQVSGITCGTCVAKVKSLLEKIPGVIKASVGLDAQVEITMDRHIATADLQAALRDYPQYELFEKSLPMPTVAALLDKKDDERGFFETYKPVLLVFSYIFGATLLIEFAAGYFDWMRWMRHFMAGFFLVFSFFKMLDRPAFAVSYSSYDVVARRWLGWGYMYPFVELGLGILFLLNFQPVLTNWLTLIVMGVSTVGVVQSLLKKRRFQCACLGAVFNLPMSHITLVEDLLMVVMSGVMLLMIPV
ncbi:MAG: cation transporter [Chitinophagales bacterium]|nr:cation transporter [Chitinophagales bacterium]